MEFYPGIVNGTGFSVMKAFFWLSPSAIDVRVS